MKFGGGGGGFFKRSQPQSRSLFGNIPPDFWGGFKNMIMQRRAQPRDDMMYIQPYPNPGDMGGGSPPFYIPDRRPVPNPREMMQPQNPMPSPVGGLSGALGSKYGGYGISHRPGVGNVPNMATPTNTQAPQPMTSFSGFTPAKGFTGYR